MEKIKKKFEKTADRLTVNIRQKGGIKMIRKALLVYYYRS
jgi:hypothetical protein